MRARWYPLAELSSEVNRMRQEMDRLFDRFQPGGRRAWAALGGYPALNVWEDDDAFHVEAELPGLELADLELLVTGGNLLTLKGQRKPIETNGGTWHRRERNFGSFSRSVELPGQVDADKVEAQFRQGVLLVHLPKAEQAKPRRIEVRGE